MENSFKSLVESANSVLILLPNKPFFDQVAAALSLNLSFTEKINSQVYCSSPMLVEFNRLVGVNKIVSEFGNKNLVISLAGYPANDIEKVSYDIENSQFQLAVVPKSGMLPPKKEQVRLAYTGSSADLLILIGGADESHFPSLDSKDFSGVKTVHIGSRTLSTSQGRGVMSFARPSSSVSEVVYALIKESEFNIDSDIATNLLTGIEDGSKKFSTNGVTAETFQAVADLMKTGGKRGVGKTLPRKFVPTQPPASSRRPVIRKQTPQTPKDWLGPKIYKGTSVS